MKVRTCRDAIRFLDDAGLAYVFPDNKTPLPSLWGAVCGDPMREMDGDDWGWTKAVERTWDLKNEVGASLKGYFGRFVRGKGTLVALHLLEPLAALLREEGGLSSGARETYERLGNVGAMSTLRLRESLRLHGTKGNRVFNKVTLELYRRLLIANVGVDGSETRWPAAVIDRLDRAHAPLVRRASKLPRAEAAAQVRRRLPRAEPRFLAAITGVPAREWPSFAVPRDAKSGKRP